MVSTIDTNQGVYRQKARQEPLNFPFATQPPPAKSSTAKPSSHSSSPSLTDVTLTDDDANVSSHDEFYLEKYSARSGASPYPPSRQERSPSPRKRARPELNIVTHLPATQVRACDPDVTVEHVGAKRTAAKIRPKSVVSSKAEHFDSSLLVERTRAFATIKNLAQARRDRKQARHGGFEQLEDSSVAVNGNDELQGLRKQGSAKRKDSSAVVIGISIPKEQAVAHQSQADFSAVTLNTPTPTTPAIVITPAEAEYPLDTQGLIPPQHNARGARPASSIYSDSLSYRTKTGANEDIPPVPVVPHIPGKHKRRQSTSGAREQESDERASRKSRRFSAGSATGVQRAEVDTSRHKSQGWWNLALSPMLSRAGTIRSQRPRRMSDSPEVPPVPGADAFKGRARSGTQGSQISPETPRRLGLAGIRASIWSHWTTEHKGRHAARESVDTTYPERGDQDQDDDLSDLDPQEALPRELPFQDPMAAYQPRMAGGLADEYYHACAIEQLSGQPYFECENHSCAEGWPHFQSIFDRENDDGLATQETSTRSVQEDSGRSGRAAVIAAGAAGAVAAAAITAAALHRRTSSGDSGPAAVSPNVRQADTGSVVQARAVERKTPPLEQEVIEANRSVYQAAPASSSAPSAPTPAAIPIHDPSTASAPRSVATPEQISKYPNIAAIVPQPPNTADMSARIVSPGPVSPEMQRAMAAQGALPMNEMRSIDQQTRGHSPIIQNYYNYLPPQEVKEPPLQSTNEVKDTVVVSPRSMEEDKPKKAGMAERIKAWAAARKAAKSSQTAEKKKSKKSRCIAILIFLGLLMMIAGSLLLALLLTRTGDETPTSTQWLNLTGYPPMPTGISTIIRPDVVVQQSQCIQQPATAWSCSLPPEKQDEVAPNNPDQPNFRFEIKFRNGTVASNLTLPVDSLRKRASDPFTNALFTPSPAPPSRAEQIFLGNTTDNITAPFDGEDTPFYMTFIPAFPIDPSDLELNASSNSNTKPRLTSRQQSDEDSLANLIPSPDMDGSGLAAPANLLPESPFPFSQPIRFYNRGLPDEHFGFYMYYDRSIFLTSQTRANNTSSNDSVIVTPNNPNTPGGNSSDANGGVARINAVSRCTFSQTRFVVQIFTNPAFDGTITGSVPEVGGKESGNSAINYTPPGSFPYPTTITLDRHGGNVNKKAAYCYGVDGEQRIMPDVKAFLLEFRGVGGTTVNGAPDLLLPPGDSDGGFDQDAGGIDGGTGGCKCAWQNWS